MTRRHPRQILNPADLAPGEVYAFVFAQHVDRAFKAMAMTPVAFAGTLATSFRGVVKAIGGCRSHAECYLTLHTLSSTHPSLYGLWIRDSSGYNLNDIPGFRCSGGAHDLLPDPPWARLPDGTYAAHRLVVALHDWIADPRLHAADWVDPGDSCEAAGDWAAKERILKARKNAELRRLLGFD